MARAGGYRNVFDDQNEFDKLQNLILKAIQDFSEYRNGSLTYGEIMFVIESILDSMRQTSEKDAHTARIKGMREAPTFSTLYSVTARLLEVGIRKGVFSSEDEAYILHGEKK